MGFWNAILPSLYALSMEHFTIPFWLNENAHSLLFTNVVVKSFSASKTATPFSSTAFIPSLRSLRALSLHNKLI